MTRLFKLSIFFLLFFCGLSCSSGGSSDDSEASDPIIGDFANQESAETAPCVGQIPEAPIRRIIFEEFGNGSDCAPSAPWEFLKGPITSGQLGCALRYELFAGDPDEQTPAQAELDEAGLRALTGTGFHRHLRVRWREYYVPGYHFPAGQKVARFFNSEGTGVEASIIINDRNQGIGLTLFVSDGIEIVEYSDNINSVRPGQSALRGVSPGEAVMFELEVFLPDRNRRGFASLNVNGATVRVETDAAINELPGSCLSPFSGVWVGGNWTNGGPGVESRSTRFIDSIEIFAR